VSAPSDRVRVKTGVPVASDFASSVGTPIVIDDTASTGTAYFMDAGGTIVPLGRPLRGSWTPVLTFVTPGDLAVTYASQLAYYEQIGKQMTVHFAINTSAFTHTTAAGDLKITGIPAAVGAYSLARFQGSMRFGGITKAGYTNFTVDATAGNNFLIFSAGGSGVAASTVTAADMPTGGTVVLRGSVTYFID